MVSLLALAAGVNYVPAVVPVMSKQRGKESQELIESGPQCASQSYPFERVWCV